MAVAAVSAFWLEGENWHEYTTDCSNTSCGRDDANDTNDAYDNEWAAQRTEPQ